MQGLATAIGPCLILTGAIVGLVSALRKRPETVFKVSEGSPVRPGRK